MEEIDRRKFLVKMGLLSGSIILFHGCDFGGKPVSPESAEGGTLAGIATPEGGENIFSYIHRMKGNFDQVLYQQIVGSANEFKEGDQTLGVAADSDTSRQNARTLLANTKIEDLNQHSLFRDEIYDLIEKTSFPDPDSELLNLTMGELKTFVLEKSEDEIKAIMPALSSDIIGCLVKLMTNDELITVGQKVFNPLPNSKIGSKGYMSARVQPNSPTDNVDDIVWQVFDAWSYGVGDLVLGTNPVSSEPDSVAKIEQALFDVITTFELGNTLPNCVLSHIDVQSVVESTQPGTTGIWFQSLAGTVDANKTFDVTIEKMFRHAGQRTGKYGLYAETGQGADFTNGHGKGFDMVIHEARKYGFLRALKLEMTKGKKPEDAPWVHVNDVAGFIGPEVFKTREQLVRCCLEDTVMGKLHGLTIGLDICSTLHMEVTLEDLDWCIEQVMPANPAYLMALPTKNDPMLSYLTTAFNNHVKVREQFGYKVNDDMWDFFKRLEVIGADDQPTEHFGDPLWVYYKFRQAKNDLRSKSEIYAEGQQKLQEIRDRGVPIAEGYGDNTWDLEPELDKEVHRLYEDAKVSLWTELTPTFVSSLPATLPIVSQSKDRKDYVYHPESGEQLRPEAKQKLIALKKGWGQETPDVQIIISDGLNARSLMDDNHLSPFLDGLIEALEERQYRVSQENIVITNGRVRAGYQCGEILFGQSSDIPQSRGIIHIIGERPGSGHHNFSAYLTVAPQATWHQEGKVDHNITKVVSGISDTALTPELAVIDTMSIFDQLFTSSRNVLATGV